MLILARTHYVENGTFVVFPVAGLYNVIYLLNFINYSGEPSGYEARLVGGADNTTTLTDTANAFVDEGRGPENHVSFSSEIISSSRPTKFSNCRFTKTMSRLCLSMLHYSLNF